MLIKNKCKKDKLNDKRLELIDLILIYGSRAVASGELGRPAFDFSHIHLLRVIVGAAIMMYCRILGIIIANDGNCFGLVSEPFESNENVFFIDF